ncbi:enoyl-CoA-hydratase DpgB [Planosporangium sp. 12N6]|uniref:enoyl-CoA-hydratase DpgB n=1 Tax=Planosporangium spinosum TaxID=3402278 RepID=UPI003CF5F587
MAELSRLTDFYLELDGSAVLSASLVERVNAVCRQVGEGRKDAVLLVRVAGGRDGAEAPERTGVEAAWPYDVDVHTVNQWERALRRLERLPAVTVAAVDGTCRGPALDALLTTDYRVATADTRLGVPTSGRGTWPGMAIHRLANQVGVARARRLALFGTALDAAHAVEWGLLDEVAGDLTARCRDVIDRFAGTSGKELSIRRQLLFDASATSFEDALGSHLAACDRAIRLAGTGPDAAPGLVGVSG